jgi:hypothetical protein
MKRRREHGECDTRPDGRGCLVFGTKMCTFRKKQLGKTQQFKKFSRTILGKLGVLLWWLCLTLLGAGVAWGWMENQRRTAPVGMSTSVATQGNGDGNASMGV